MPSTKKAPARPSGRSKPAAAARARLVKNEQALGRIAKSLEAAQKDLAAIGGSLGTGARDVRKDVAKLLRDANRDVTKMAKALRRDLERLQKDVSAASKPKARRAPAAKTRTGAAKKTGAGRSTKAQAKTTKSRAKATKSRGA